MRAGTRGRSTRYRAESWTASALRSSRRPARRSQVTTTSRPAEPETATFGERSTSVDAAGNDELRSVVHVVQPVVALRIEPAGRGEPVSCRRRRRSMRRRRRVSALLCRDLGAGARPRADRPSTRSQRSLLGASAPSRRRNPQRPARIPHRDLRGFRVERHPRLLRGPRRGHPPGSARTGSKAPTRLGSLAAADPTRFARAPWLARGRRSVAPAIGSAGVVQVTSNERKRTMKRYVCTVATGLLLALVSTGTATAIVRSRSRRPDRPDGDAGRQLRRPDGRRAEERRRCRRRTQGNGNLNIAPAIGLFGDAETTNCQGNGNTATADIDQSNSVDQSQSSESEPVVRSERRQLSCCGGQSQTGEQTGLRRRPERRRAEELRRRRPAPGQRQRERVPGGFRLRRCRDDELPGQREQTPMPPSRSRTRRQSVAVVDAEAVDIRTRRLRRQTAAAVRARPATQKVHGRRPDASEKQIRTTLDVEPVAGQRQPEHLPGRFGLSAMPRAGTIRGTTTGPMPTSRSRTR